MRCTGIGRLFGFAVGTMLAWQGAAQAQTPEEFYKGKIVTLVVAAAPGGAADTVGRSFAPYFQKHLPGRPELIVVNKPGAGGMKAASELMVSEEKDGTVIALLLGNNLFNPLVDDKHKQFDPRKVQWLGSIDIGQYPYTVLAWKTSPVQSADEIFQKKMVIGSTSFTHQNRVLPAIMNKYLGARFDIVPGYEGSGDVFLAMERGEADGWFQGFAALENTDKAPGSYLKDGKMKPLMIIGFEKHPDWPDLPLITDYTKTEEDKRMVRFFLTPVRAGRPLAVPGEVPADRVAALRQAFQQTFDDPEFIAKMQEVMNLSTLVGITGKDVDDMIADIYSTPDATLAAAREMLVQK